MSGGQLIYCYGWENGATTLENHFVASPKVNHTLSDLNHRHSPKRNENIYSQKDFVWIFKLALFIIAPNWKESKCSPAGEGTAELLHSQTMEYYSPIIRN